MIRNNRSYIVWEIRLAGALTTFLGLQCLSGLGWFQGLRFLFPWINFSLAILFLVSTGWAYRFENPSGVANDDLALLTIRCPL